MARHRRSRAATWALPLAVLGGGLLGATLYCVITGSWRAWWLTATLAVMAASLVASVQIAVARSRPSRSASRR